MVKADFCGSVARELQEREPNAITCCAVKFSRTIDQAAVRKDPSGVALAFAAELVGGTARSGERLDSSADQGAVGAGGNVTGA